MKNIGCFKIEIINENKLFCDLFILILIMFLCMYFEFRLFFKNVGNLICIWNKLIYKLKCKRKILLDFDGVKCC